MLLLMLFLLVYPILSRMSFLHAVANFVSFYVPMLSLMFFLHGVTNVVSSLIPNVLLDVVPRCSRYCCSFSCTKPCPSSCSSMLSTGILNLNPDLVLHAVLLIHGVASRGHVTLQVARLKFFTHLKFWPKN